MKVINVDSLRTFCELIALPSINKNEELTESGKHQESFTKGHYRQPILMKVEYPLLPYQRG